MIKELKLHKRVSREVKHSEEIVLTDRLGKRVNKEILGHTNRCSRITNLNKNNDLKTTNIYSTNDIDSPICQYNKLKLTNLNSKKSKSKLSLITCREESNSPKLIVLHHRPKRLSKHRNATVFHDSKVISRSNKSVSANNNIKIEGNPDCKEQRINDSKLINNRLFLKHEKGIVGKSGKPYKGIFPRKRYIDSNKTLSINSNPYCVEKTPMLQHYLRKVFNSEMKANEILDKIKNLPIKFEESQLFFMNPSHIAKMLQYCNNSTEETKSCIKKREISCKKYNTVKNDNEAKVITNCKEKCENIGCVNPLIYCNTDQNSGSVNNTLHSKKQRIAKINKFIENEGIVQNNTNKRMVKGQRKTRRVSNQRHKHSFDSFKDKDLTNNLSYNSKLSTIYSASLAVRATKKESTNFTSSNAIILKDGLSNTELSHINDKVGRVQNIGSLIVKSVEGRKRSRTTQACKLPNNIKRKLKNDNFVKCHPKDLGIANDKYSPNYVNDMLPLQKDHLMVFYANREPYSTSKDSLNIAIRRDTEISDLGNSNNVLNVVIKQTKNTMPKNKSFPLKTVKIEGCENSEIEKTILTYCNFNSCENLGNFEYERNDYRIKEVACQTDFDIAYDCPLNGICVSNELNYSPKHCYLDPDANKSEVLNALESNNTMEINSLKIINKDLFKNSCKNVKSGNFSFNSIEETSKSIPTVSSEIGQVRKENMANETLNNDHCDAGNEGTEQPQLSYNLRVESNSKLNIDISSSNCYPDIKSLETKLKEIGLEKKEGFVRVIESPRYPCLSDYESPNVSNLMYHSISIDSIHGHLSNEYKENNNKQPIQITSTLDYKTNKSKVGFEKKKNLFTNLKLPKNKGHKLEETKCKFQNLVNSECDVLSNGMNNDLNNYKSDKPCQKNKNSDYVYSGYFKNNLQVCKDQQENLKFHNNIFGKGDGLEKACNCIGALKNFAVSEIGVQTDDLLESYTNHDISVLESYTNHNISVQRLASVNNNKLNNKLLPQVTCEKIISNKRLYSNKVDTDHQFNKAIQRLLEKKGSFVHIIENDVGINNKNKTKQNEDDSNGSKCANDMYIDNNLAKYTFGERDIKCLDVFNSESSNMHQQTVNKINAIYEFLLYLEKLLKDNVFIKINNCIDNDNVLQFNKCLRCLRSDCLEILHKCEAYTIHQSNSKPMVIGSNNQLKFKMELTKNKQDLTLPENNLQFQVEKQSREPFFVIVPSKENLKKISDSQFNQTDLFFKDLTKSPSISETIKPNYQSNKKINSKSNIKKYTYVPTKKNNQHLREKDNHFSIKNNDCVNTEKLNYNNLNIKDSLQKLNCHIDQNVVKKWINKNETNSFSIKNSEPRTYFHFLQNSSYKNDLFRKSSSEENEMKCFEGRHPLSDKSKHSALYNMPFFHVIEQPQQMNGSKTLVDTSPESNTTYKKYLSCMKNTYSNYFTKHKNTNLSINNKGAKVKTNKSNHKNNSSTIYHQIPKLNNLYFFKSNSECSIISLCSMKRQYANNGNMKLLKQKEPQLSKSTFLLPAKSSIKYDNSSNQITYKDQNRDQNLLREDPMILDPFKDKTNIEFNNVELLEEHYARKSNLSKPKKQTNYSKKENIEDKSPFTLSKINSESSLDRFSSQCCNNSIVFVNQELQSTSQRHYNNKGKNQYFEKGNIDNSSSNKEQVDQCFSVHKNNDWIPFSECNLPQLNKSVAIKNDLVGSDVESESNNLRLQMNIKMNEIIHVKLFCQSPDYNSDLSKDAIIK